MAIERTYREFEGASVLITGGGSGIGAALTQGFVANGARVAFIDVAQAESQILCATLDAQYGQAPLYLNADLTDPDAITDAVRHACERNGPVTILVNNAAWDDRHELDAVDAEYFEKNMAINLRHQLLTAQAVVPGMKAQGGGAIINMTSTSYMLNIGDMPVYTAAKAGVVGLTKGLAGKLGPFNIRVNAVAPGWVMTKRQKELWVTPEGLDKMLERQCLKQPLQPEQMIGPVLFLASNAASAITAQTIIADGGIL